MKVIVITGGTKGIGFALADSFLAVGCSVVLCGRTEDRATGAAESLAKKYGGERVAGFACDVRDRKQVGRLWDSATTKFGRVDIWVNNAGLSAAQMQTWQIPEREIAAVVETNLTGVIYGSQVAVRGMLAQGHGAIYNMGGAGSDGRMHDGFVPYGATKYAVSYLTRCLARELKGTPLIIGLLRPGMVITEMITAPFKNRPEEWKRAKRIFSIIGNRPEQIAPWLTKRMLENRRTGVCITYLTAWRLMWQIMTAPLRRKDLFPEDAI